MELKVTKKVLTVHGQPTTVYEVKQYVEVLDIDGKKVKVSLAPAQTLTAEQYTQTLAKKQAEVDELTAAKIEADK